MVTFLYNSSLQEKHQADILKQQLKGDYQSHTREYEFLIIICFKNHKKKG